MASARSSIVGAAVMTPSTLATTAHSESASAMAFPRTGSMRRSGDSCDIFSDARSVNPLNTESTHTMAIDARATPVTEMREMTLTALWVFLEKRYRKATRSVNIYCSGCCVGFWSSLWSFARRLSMFSR